ncbi:MAG: hypothetical protein GC191_02615 [Azospirillum sp.]|nr:hypothetical protein [Azospirillum sp.]
MTRSPLTRRLPAIGLGLALLGMPVRQPFAEQLVVAEGSGVKFLAGQAIDGDQPLTLSGNQSLTLIAANGRVIKLRGPFAGAPGPGQAQAVDTSVIKALRDLTEPAHARTDTPGVIRGGLPGVPAPEPWLVAVGQSARRCILREEPIVLWRPRNTAPAVIAITHSTGAPAMPATTWPAGVDRLTLPDSFPVVDGGTYQVIIDRIPTALILNVLPRAVTQAPARVAWMALKGCDSQARALLDTIAP